MVRLSDVFAYSYYEETSQQDKQQSTTADSEMVCVVVVQGEGREIGIVVDALLGNQDIVIKSLDDELVDARGLAGGAILGDGTVTLILDIAEVQKMAIDTERYEDVRRNEAIRIFAEYVREHGVGRNSILS